LSEQDKVQNLAVNYSEWKTDFNKHVIDFAEIKSSPAWPKDMHPAIHNPEFSAVKDAGNWLASGSPVISFIHKGKARAYPLEVLLYHEIANDEVLDLPIAVTYCPLCNTAIVFNRHVNGQILSFGVAGVLRKSNLVMYDRSTDSWWQQVTGQGIIGKMAGVILEKFPSQVISFEQFSQAYPKGRILTPYFWGTNRYYKGYDDIDSGNKPKYCPDKIDTRLHPTERLVTLEIKGEIYAYPYSETSRLRVINDELAGTSLVIFHSPGAVSPVDSNEIAQSREVGSTGVFDRKVDGEMLSFSYKEGRIRDDQTGSFWDITGRCEEGRLEGKELEKIVHGDDFWFVWITFHPDSKVFGY